jgi:lysophospholipid acyltransferase
MLHLVGATVVTFLFIKYYGRKQTAFVILILTVLHLSLLHIYRMVVDYGGWYLDITTVYMMSVCKFSTIAFSYEDGAKEDSVLKSNFLISKYI